MKPMKQCNHVGCKTLIDYDERYCEKHKLNQSVSVRTQRKATEGRYFRFYESRTWRKASYLYRLKHPCCEECLKEGVVKKADVVDHIIELKDDWSKRLDDGNFQSLCHKHHNEKTANEKKKREKSPDEILGAVKKIR